MGLEIGYVQVEKGEKFYVKYPYKNYGLFLSNVTGDKDINKDLLVKFFTLTSTYESKYAIKMKNFFFFRMNQSMLNSNRILQLINFNLEIATKSKMTRMINFDIQPVFKLSIHNESTRLPFILGMKYGHYQAGRSQCLDRDNFQTYDFSSVVKSMLPHHRVGVSLSHSNVFPFGNIISTVYRIKGSLNKILNYEDNVKLSNDFRTTFQVNIFEKICKMFVTNQFIMKKSFIFPKLIRQEDTLAKNVFKKYDSHHIISGLKCMSKLVEMNILSEEEVIDNGCDFYIQNALTLRLGDFPLLKNSELFSRIHPYASLETILVPEKKENETFDIKKSLQFIYSLGLSIKLQESFFLDFSIFSGSSSNLKIKKHYINRFRLKLGT